MKGQQAAAASEQVPQDSGPAGDGKSRGGGKQGRMESLKDKAGRCLQKVMPGCMQPPSVHTTSHRQTDVQPSPAVAGSVRTQRPAGEEASVQKQRLSRLTGLFKHKKAASKQALSGVPAGTLATQPLQEPSGLIAAVRQQHHLAQQADLATRITTPANKPATQVSTGIKLQLSLPLSPRDCPSPTITRALLWSDAHS